MPDLNARHLIIEITPGQTPIVHAQGFTSWEVYTIFSLCHQACEDRMVEYPEFVGMVEPEDIEHGD